MLAVSLVCWVEKLLFGGFSYLLCLRRTLPLCKNIFIFYLENTSCSMRTSLWTCFYLVKEVCLLHVNLDRVDWCESSSCYSVLSLILRWAWLALQFVWSFYQFCLGKNPGSPLLACSFDFLHLMNHFLIGSWNNGPCNHYDTVTQTFD